MADKKRPPRYDLKTADRNRGRWVQIGLTAIVVIFAVVLVGAIVLRHDTKPSAGQAIRVTSSKLITADGGEPKVVMSFYEDFLCPMCGEFERTFGPTVDRLIDIGAIAADYHMVNIVSPSQVPQRQHYSGRAGAAAYCVADESIDAFRRFHAKLFNAQFQPAETDTSFPDNARLIELARQAGAAGKVPDCINSGKYLEIVDGMALAAHISGTPTVRINGEDYHWSKPEELVAKIKGIVGDVPGLEPVPAKP